MSHLARFVTWSALSLRLVETVNINIVALGRIGDDFIPLDCFDVAKIVVVQNSNTAFQNICNKENNYIF